LAKPSVQIITIDPGFPYFANYNEAIKAGPRAVYPFSCNFSNFYNNNSADFEIG